MKGIADRAPSMTAGELRYARRVIVEALVYGLDGDARTAAEHALDLIAGERDLRRALRRARLEQPARLERLGVRP